MIRKVLVFVLVAVFGLLLQSKAVHALSPTAVAPDIIVVLVVYLGLTTHTFFGAIGAFLLGILSDFASGQYIGPNAAGALLGFLLTMVLARKVYADQFIAVIILTFICCLLKSICLAAMLATYVGFQPVTSMAFRVLLLEAFFSAVVAPFAVSLLRWGYHEAAAGDLFRRPLRKR